MNQDNNRSHLVQFLILQLPESELQHMKQNGTKCIFYIITFSETNRKTWGKENVRETESHPLYSLSACAYLTNQFLSCWVNPRICLDINTDAAIVTDLWTGVGWTPRPVLFTGAKESHLGCLISFGLPMGFQNFVVINKIYPLKKQKKHAPQTLL